MLTTPTRIFAPRFRAPHKPRAQRSTARVSSSMAASHPKEGVVEVDSDAVSLSEWQGWGTSSPVPAMVAEVVQDLKALERDMETNMSFGGLGGKLQGNFKVQEDKKHRAVYETLIDSEMKLQFFAARQIACRLLGSRGYLCQKCWLPMEDCMCSRLAPCTLWNGIKFWLYMHPKDFLRQNNTGKLLWQIFGTQAASLCLFGIHELEEIMWDAFRHSGKGMVWFLYPNKNSFPKSIQEVVFDEQLMRSEDQKRDLRDKAVNFVLIDGTWSNSAAMYRRLKEMWTLLYREEDPPCISLSTLGASIMHKLRPQPAWDRTCTAAAAAGLLSELHIRTELTQLGLDKQAEAVETSLDVLLDALTTRRLRKGRSITRRERHNNCI